MKYEDKTRQKRWEARTFLQAMALLARSQGLFLRGLGHKVHVSIPGFPLPIPSVGERTPEVKARKKFMRQQKRARIRRRGF